MRRRVFLLVLFVVAATDIAEAREGFNEIQVVPVPGKVAVDGDLKDWDLSGTIETFYDESMLPSFSVKLGFMYDAEALYLSADFIDDTPMVNAHDPQIEADRGWAGDCLQVRLCSDPAEKYPLVADTVATQGNDSICHLTMWYYTPRNERCSTSATAWRTAGRSFSPGRSRGWHSRRTPMARATCSRAGFPGNC